MSVCCDITVPACLLVHASYLLLPTFSSRLMRVSMSTDRCVKKCQTLHQQYMQTSGAKTLFGWRGTWNWSVFVNSTHTYLYCFYCQLCEVFLAKDPELDGWFCFIHVSGWFNELILVPCHQNDSICLRCFHLLSLNHKWTSVFPKLTWGKRTADCPRSSIDGYTKKMRIWEKIP